MEEIKLRDYQEKGIQLLYDSLNKHNKMGAAQPGLAGQVLGYRRDDHSGHVV